MKVLGFRSGRSLVLVLAGVTLASCVAHGQQPSMSGLSPELSSLPHWKVFRSHSSHNEHFFRNLRFGRAFVYEQPGTSDSVVGEFVHDDGRRFLCTRRKGHKKYVIIWSELSFETHSTGAADTTKTAGRVGRSLIFYEPKSGALRNEYLALHDDPHKRYWVKFRSGWVQDSWPRALADACPVLVDELPAGMEINEKQTSLRKDELRRQDPDAPIRNFPGSHLTAPGTTGLGASAGRPTTTKSEVEAFLKAQEGNILKWTSPGYTYVRNGDREEFWRLPNVSQAEKFFDIVRSDDGNWMTIGEITYPIGYPFPYLPTGHRHPAFQLTDEFLAKPYPRPLEFMGEAYADKRFVFHPEGKFSVVDEAGNLVAGPHFDGIWRWTRGTLEMTVRDDPAGPKVIHWRTLAHQLGMQPKIWSRYSRDVGGW